jgi:lipoprotein Spr
MISRVLRFVLAAFLFTSCSLLKQTAIVESKKTDGPFMEKVNVTIHPIAVSYITPPSSNPFQQTEKTISPQYAPAETPQDIEQFIPAAFRFSLLLNVEVESLNNKTLFEYISRWWGTPYRTGGNDMNGIDCSGFIKGLSAEAYKKELPRTSSAQSAFCIPITRDELQEGDLVFFKTGRRSISHVGMYLANNKFVHASTSVGVTISDMDEPYWKNRLVKIGRMPFNKVQ